MGDLQSTQQVAKLAARMGLTLSATREGVHAKPKHVDDVVVRDEYTGDVKYIMSDGCAAIGEGLAARLISKLGCQVEDPSGFQVRWNGYKGMLTRWGARVVADDEAQVRRSMIKFECDENVIEVVGWSRFLPGYLNRQIITLMSTLGIADEVFHQYQDQMMTLLTAMMENPLSAWEALCWLGEKDDHVVELMKLLLSSGTSLSEPFLQGCLSTMRRYMVRDIRDRARIFVKDAANLYGVMDELGVLDYGQVFIRVMRSVPTIGGSATKQDVTITGRVVVVKSPCLHPGDIRILEAVNPPEFQAPHVIRNMVVFPSRGPRPHQDEIAGSDSDGDMYYVFWAPDLVPDKSVEPYDYHPPEVRKSSTVGTEELVNFFLTYMEKDQLGQIDNAHLAWSDKNWEKGKAASKECLQLVGHHHMAVDFAKTGRPATLPHKLRSSKYPHFMGKEPWMSYQSRGVLGQLYDKATLPLVPSWRVSNLERSGRQVELEKGGLWPLAILSSFPSHMCEAASSVLDSYLLGLHQMMTKWSISDPFELITGWVLRPQEMQKRKKMRLRPQVVLDVQTFWQQFRAVFFGDERECCAWRKQPRPGEAMCEQCQVYLMKAKVWYLVALQRWQVLSPTGEGSEGHDDIITFPWVIGDVMVCAILQCHRDERC